MRSICSHTVFGASRRRSSKRRSPSKLVLVRPQNSPRHLAGSCRDSRPSFVGPMPDIFPVTESVQLQVIAVAPVRSAHSNITARASGIISSSESRSVNQSPRI